MKRKNILSFAAGIFFTISSLLSFQASAKMQLENSPAKTNMLFIQVASSGELIPKEHQPNSYLLVLKDVDAFTSYFSNRPKRVTGILSTNQFVKLWKNQDIENSPPNVAIETSNSNNGNHINSVFILKDPVYDAVKKQITYNAQALNKKAAPAGHLTIGYTVLFIDDFDWNGNKF